MIDYVPEPVGISALVARCDADGRVGFVLHATSVAEMMAVADEEGLMPPKSSYFEPKPRSGVFVRRLDRDQSYLASSRVEVWETIDRWLDDAMPTVARQRIRAVATLQPNGDRVGVFHTDPDGRDFKIADIPPGMKPLHDTAGNALGSAMGFLDFEDVRKAGRVDFAGANLAEFKTFDGLTVKFLVVKHKDGPKDIFWMQISAAFDAADIQLDGLSDKQREIMKSPDAARTEAADINKRYGPWAFQVPDYKAKDFMTPPDALLVRDDGKSKN